MGINQYTSEELKQMSYCDVAYILLQTKKSAQDFQKIFAEVTQVLGMDATASKEIISKFYTELSLDGRFAILADTKWDLKTRHVYDDLNPEVLDFLIEEEIVEPDVVEEEEEEDEDDSLDFDSTNSDDDEKSGIDEDIKKLVIIDEEDL